MSTKWNFYHYEGKHLDQVFYELYDSNFVASKCHVLKEIVEHFDAAKEFFASFKLDLEEKDKIRFNAEIYFSEFHQFEALFALLLAPFESEPHSIYMLTYNARDIRAKVKAYLEGNIELLTKGRIGSQIEFLEEAVYSGIKAPDTEGDWSVNLDNIRWLFQRLAQKYRDAHEYNFYKHGVRAVPVGSTFFRIASSETDEQIAEWESDNSIRFYEIEGNGQDIEIKDVIRQFDPEESIAHLQVMDKLISTIQATRLAKMTKAREMTITTFYDIDRERSKELRMKDFRFGISIGKQSRGTASKPGESAA